MPNLLATAVSHILESLADGDTATADHIEAHLNDPAALQEMFGDDDAPEEEEEPDEPDANEDDPAEFADQPRGDADNAGHFAKKDGGSSESAKADKPKVAKGFTKRPKWAADPAMKSVLDIFDGATGHERTALDTALDRAGLLTSDAKTGDSNGYEKSPSSDPEQIKNDLAHGLASGYGTFAGKHPVDGIAKALEALGAKQQGKEGEQEEFDGAVHEHVPGAFTGHAVKVVRPGWVLPGEDGRDVVLLKARVAKEGEGNKFAEG